MITFFRDYFKNLLRRVGMKLRPDTIKEVTDFLNRDNINVGDCISIKVDDDGTVRTKITNEKSGR